MPRIWVRDADQLTVTEVTHKQFSTLPATATVGEVREWFAESSHRRMAFLADGGRYVGSLTPADLTEAADADAERPASDLAHDGPTVAPDAPASVGHQLALASDALRVPVVDPDGTLLGVVAVTTDLAGFCGAA
jgi:CBS domain-containing protein